MGKTLHQHHPGIFLQGNGPTGCMWGVLHVLNYQNWRQIKKRLSHKKGGSGSSKHESKVYSLKDTIKALKIDPTIEDFDAGNEDSNVDEKSAQCSTPSKGSVASRLKALISDEIYKFKGRHHRSATCPGQSQLTRTYSIHHLDSSYKDIISPAKLHDESSVVVDDERTPSNPSLINYTQLSSKDQKFQEGDIMLTDSPSMGRKQVIKQFSGNQFNVDSPTHQTKEKLDALDIDNKNKNSILEILKISDSPLAHQCHKEQAIKNKLGYSKNASFPSTESSYKRVSRPRKGESKKKGVSSYMREENLQDIGHEEPKMAKYMSKEYFRSRSTPTIAAEYRADGILKLNQAIAKTANNQLRKKGHNQVAIKQFKDLRHKIKHAIKESKHEKHRIAMDAILHKIPHRHGFSKDLRKEIFDQTKDRYLTRDSPRSSYESDRSIPSTIKSEMRTTSRTSSFSTESLDRYCQLYECNFNKETKPYSAESSRLRSEHGNLSRMGTTKSVIRRIFSLPNIKYTEVTLDAFAANQGRSLTDGVEDHNHPATTEQVRQLDTKSDLNYSGLGDSDKESISNDEGWEEEKLKSNSKVELDANVFEIDDNANSMITKEMTIENKPQVVANSITNPEDLGTINSMFDFDAHEAETRHSPSSKVKEEDFEPSQTYFHPTKLDILCEQLEEFSVDTPETIKTKDDKAEFSSNSKYGKFVQLQVNAKDKAEFDYVRYILDVSGFIKNEELGTWHSEEHPMNRSVLEEVKDYMFFDPKHCGSEESASCYEMLLFDLINEVLMEIYAKSYAYYPKQLTSFSQIRPMPKGHHVFEEVWDSIGLCLNPIHENDDHRSLDYIVSRDLAKSDRWMHVQNEAECVGLELEDLIFDHLLEEIICS